MPVTVSAKKALRRDRQRTQVNLRIKRKVKMAIKKGVVAEAYRMLDRAAKKGVMHKKKAARLKSRLAKAIKAKAIKKA